MNKRVSLARPRRRRSAEDWVGGAGGGADRRAPIAEAASVPTKRLTLDIPEELHRRVKSGCALRGEKIVEVVPRFLEAEVPPPR